MRWWGKVLSAEAAALDKVLAGESRAVEHVAELHPSQAARVAAGAAGKGMRRKRKLSRTEAPDDGKHVGDGGGEDGGLLSSLGARQTKRRRTRELPRGKEEGGSTA
jgi:hypothetical protein